MKIIYDCTSAQPDKGILVNGGGEYSVRLLEELLVEASKVSITVLISSERGENRKILELCKKMQIDVLIYTSLEDMSYLVNKGEFDLLVLPICYPNYYRLDICEKIRIVGLIHDLSSFYQSYLGVQPGQFCKMDGMDWLRCFFKTLVKRSEMKRKLKMHKSLFSINSLTQIYTVSYYTKSALEFFLPHCEIKDVFYSPLKRNEIIDCQTEKELLENMEIKNEKFFLLSNISRWTKNNIRAIQAIDEMFSDIHHRYNIKNYKIVLLGCTEKYIKYLKKTIRNIDRFVLRGFVSQMDMEILYKNAYAYIYPSLLEGFGYPPIEAMKYGTLSICSTSTSITEICGDAVIYFEPLEKDSLKMAILRALNEEYYNSFMIKMQHHYQYITDKQEKDLHKLCEIICSVEGT